MFSVDGTARHTQPTPIGGAMRFGASEAAPGGEQLSLDWVHVRPYTASGTFVSRVFERAGATNWGLYWTADTPSGTTLAMSVRAGDENPPSGSAWAPVGAAGLTGQSGRYVQYQAELGTTNTERTPLLRQVTISYNDNGAPTILVRTPASGTTDVSRGTTVVVQFSEAMDAATFTGETFRLQAGATVVPATLLVSGDTATLTPSSLLGYLTSYTVTVAGTVTDAAGNPLGLDDTWSFTTVAQDLTGPEIVNRTPAPSATGVASTANVVVQFNEPVRRDLDGTTFFLRESGSRRTSPRPSRPSATPPPWTRPPTWRSTGPTRRRSRARSPTSPGTPSAPTRCGRSRP